MAVRRLLRWLLAALGLMAVLLLAAWWAARPVVPYAFYAAPPDLPATPGQLLRHEPFERRVPAGARAWRIPYTTTRADGVNAVASAIVMVSRQEAGTVARPVIAWTHLISEQPQQPAAPARTTWRR